MKRLLHMNSEKISQEVQLPVWELRCYFITYSPFDTI